MRTLSRQLTKIIPYSKQINRGKSGLKQIQEFMSKQNHDKLILIEGLKNNEIRIVLNKLDKQKLVTIFTLDLINLELQKRDEEISSSSLNIDENMKHQDSDPTDVLLNFLIDDSYHPLRGSPVVINISCKNDKICIQFKAEKNMEKIYLTLNMKNVVI